jgi:hypothetical protein
MVVEFDASRRTSNVRVVTPLPPTPDHDRRLLRRSWDQAHQELADRHDPDNFYQHDPRNLY